MTSGARMRAGILWWLTSVATVVGSGCACGDDDDGGEGEGEGEISVRVTATEGARIDLEGGGSLEIPPDALAADTTITVSSAPPDDSLPDAASVHSDVFDFGPDGTAFDPPAILTLPFSGTPAADEETVISWLDTEAGEWADLATLVDFDAGTATAVVWHFTRFAVRFRRAHDPLECDAETDCGGPVAGRWSLQGVCFDSPSPLADCPGQSVIEVTAGGSGSLALTPDGDDDRAGAYVMRLRGSRILTVQVPDECFPAGGACADMPRETGMLFGCRDVGGVCSCRAAVRPVELVDRGAWSSVGSTLSLDSNSLGTLTFDTCTRDQQGWARDELGVVFQLRQDPETDCTNGNDDDGDGATDCADAGCAMDVAVCAPEPETCDNELDDDLDGLTDCADTDCAEAAVCLPEPCGNGTIDDGEECDGEDLGDAVCPFGGVLSCTSDCTLDDAGCSLCGNGLVDAGEDCDGDDLGGWTCQFGGVLSCTSDCTLDEAGCSRCGNGLVDAGEDCDGDDLGGNTCPLGGVLSCSVDCTLDETGCVRCGNGVMEAGEECDGIDLGGNTCALGGNLVCRADCTVDDSGCVVNLCGNGAIDAGEQCDGAALGVPDCAALGGFEGGALSCAVDCTYDTSACVLDAEVGCLDGTRDGLVDQAQYPMIAACAGEWVGHVAGASVLCDEAAGWHVCSPADSPLDYAITRAIDYEEASSFGGCYAYNASQNNNTCGTCDGADPNLDDMAGMGDACEYETSEQSSCTYTGVIDSAFQFVQAQCSYVAQLSGAMCCRTSRCGDGIVDWNEACDDGNELDGDACPSDCLQGAGCADGSRESYRNGRVYPNIAACAGGWDQPGASSVLGTVDGPACGRGAGDDGANPLGLGCNVQDLCAAGWHVCLDEADVEAHSPAGTPRLARALARCEGANEQTEAFWLTRQTSTGCGVCTDPEGVLGCSDSACDPACAPDVETTNDLFGCGTLGFPPNANCGPLTRSSGDLCFNLGPPWSCPGSGEEGELVVKTDETRGGVLCCSD